MRITKKIAKLIDLYDDATEFGGKSHANEMLDEFMEETMLPYGSSLARVNDALVECGLMPYASEEIKALIKVNEKFDKLNMRPCTLAELREKAPNKNVK